MVKIKVHDLKSFENYLGVAGKFVQQGQLIIQKTRSSLYCKNARDFSTARLLLDTNSITLDDSAECEELFICLRDITALRSSINILQTVEQVNEAILTVDTFEEDSKLYGKYIEYKGKAKFKLISVDFQVIEQFVSKNLTTELNKDWIFNIDPARLDIIQNRTSNIVNVQDDVSVYIYGEENSETNEKRVVVDLTSKKSSYVNSIALPIAENYVGKLPDDLPEIAIHESSFRLLNILRVTDKNSLICFFNNQHNIFFVTSFIKNKANEDSPEIWITSKLILGIIKGK
jgi:hypothetical protein